MGTAWTASLPPAAVVVVVVVVAAVVAAVAAVVVAVAAAVAVVVAAAVAVVVAAAVVQRGWPLAGQQPMKTFLHPVHFCSPSPWPHPSVGQRQQRPPEQPEHQLQCCSVSYSVLLQTLLLNGACRGNKDII